MDNTELSPPEQPVEALLRSFFSECERCFRFLEERHGYSFFCGLVEYKNNYKIIRPINLKGPSVEGPFTAVTRYEKNHRAIEITYSSGQFSIEAHAFYNPIDRYALSEIMAAARKPESRLEGDWGINDDMLIQDTIGALANHLEKHAQIILKPTEKLLNRAMTIRHQRLEQAIRQKHQSNIEMACRNAAKAFRQKDYRKVIQLLEPYKRYLKRSELKKLERAKKYLLS